MGVTFSIFATPLARERQFRQMLFARIDAQMLHMRYQKWQYFIRGVEQIRKSNNCIGFLENEEMQNVKKTIGESKIPESTTDVVVKNRIGDSSGAAARSKKQEKCDPHARRERWSQAGCHNNNYIYIYIYEIISSTTTTAAHVWARDSQLAKCSARQG